MSGDNYKYKATCIAKFKKNVPVKYKCWRIKGTATFATLECGDVRQDLMQSSTIFKVGKEYTVYFDEDGKMYIKKDRIILTLVFGVLTVMWLLCLISSIF